MSLSSGVPALTADDGEAALASLKSGIEQLLDLCAE